LRVFEAHRYPRALSKMQVSSAHAAMMMKLQVEEDRLNFAGSKACTFVTKMPPEEIETATLAAHKLQLKGLRDFAMLEFNSYAYLVHTWSTHMQTQLAESKFKKQVWTRPLDTVLCKRLPLEQANVREHPTEKSGFFSVKMKKIPQEWKLEYIAERLGGGDKSIEDFPRFADHFVQLFENHFSRNVDLQDRCAELFGEWAPDVRTAHEIEGALTKIVQVPPYVREKLTDRMQSEATIDGKAYLCHECGDQRPPDREKYCSPKCAAIYVSEILCPCGSKSFLQTSNGTFPTKHCTNCNKLVWIRPPGWPEHGWWLVRQAGLTAQAPEGHRPAWTKRRRIGSGEDITGAATTKRRKR